MASAFSVPIRQPMREGNPVRRPTRPRPCSDDWAVSLAEPRPLHSIHGQPFANSGAGRPKRVWIGRTRRWPSRMPSGAWREPISGATCSRDAGSLCRRGPTTLGAIDASRRRRHGFRSVFLRLDGPRKWIILERSSRRAWCVWSETGSRRRTRGQILFERRCRLMNDWVRYVAGENQGPDTAEPLTDLGRSSSVGRCRRGQPLAAHTMISSRSCQRR